MSKYLKKPKSQNEVNQKDISQKIVKKNNDIKVEESSTEQDLLK